MYFSRISLIIGAIVILAACTHTLELTSNPADTSIVKSPQSPVSIGFSDTDDELLNAVINKIGSHSRISDIKKAHKTGDSDVDYEIHLNNDVSYGATGQNFFITFPGFIIFTHAWLGYKYTADIKTTSVLMDPEGGRLSEAVIHAPYEFRFTSFPRGAAASLVGWLVPGYGLFAVIPGGIFASNYDERATPELIQMITPSYSSFVADKVIDQIASSSMSTSTIKNFKFSKEPESIVIGGEVRMSDTSNERTFITHVINIDNGDYIPIENIHKNLTEDTIQLLQRLDGTTGGRITKDNLRTIIAGLGVSGAIQPDLTIDVAVYTLRGNKMVSLYQDINNLSQVAQK